MKCVLLVTLKFGVDGSESDEKKLLFNIAENVKRILVGDQEGSVFSFIDRLDFDEDVDADVQVVSDNPK